jgi:hypothetical protein
MKKLGLAILYATIIELTDMVFIKKYNYNGNK